MDDFNISALHESNNEWGARLVMILTPLVIDGYKSILAEAIQLCKENRETDKYLMTFQNLISRVPKWNPQIIEAERKRIIDKSGCTYMEDLVTCVHIIQLKILTAMRVGQKQRKINVNIPKLDDFLHRVYINVARKVYKNVYLFETDIPPLQMQKNHRELEIIVQECILNTLRENIPVEAILKAYMEETVEEDVIEEVKEEITHEPIVVPASDTSSSASAIANEAVANTVSATDKPNSISFNEIDYVTTPDNTFSQVMAPKNIETLEELSTARYEQRRRAEEEENDDYDGERLVISDEPITLDIEDVDAPAVVDELPEFVFDDIDELL